MVLIDYLRSLSKIDKNDRTFFMESLTIKNYGSSALSDNEMWILKTASEDETYLTMKIEEAELSLDMEAPEELSLETEPTDELSLDMEAPEELSLETEPTDELTLGTEETPSELSLEEPTDELTLGTEETPSEEPAEIVTSKEGIGILPLLGDIQDRLASGKPSEVELAALKALSKLIK